MSNVSQMAVSNHESQKNEYSKKTKLKCNENFFSSEHRQKNSNRFVFAAFFLFFVLFFCLLFFLFLKLRLRFDLIAQTYVFLAFLANQTHQYDTS